MPEHWTFILLGACVIVLLGLFYYYMNRQIQGIQNAHQSLTNHILYQQKVLEKHDHLFSQTLGVPRSFSSSETIRPSGTGSVMEAPIRMETASPTIPPGVSMDTSESQVPNAFSSVASLGPMVGSILNLFQTMQPGGAVEQEEEEEEVMVSSPVPAYSTEELQRELSKELEELQQIPTTVEESQGQGVDLKKKEGRIDESFEEENKEIS